MPRSVVDQVARAWLKSRGRHACSLEWLPGDVSPRRYARARFDSGDRAIVAWYPADHRAIFERYKKTTQIVADARVRVPAILDESAAEGLMLIEDLGPRTLFEQAGDDSWHQLEGWFERAVDILQALESISPSRVAGLSPPLDGRLLRAELTLTVEHFLEPRQLIGPKADARVLLSALDALCLALERAPKTVCHRDFMVRNLIPVGDQLAVIDHQDLRLGPRGYDLASLLNDSLYPPSDAEERLLGRALGEASRLTYRRAAAQRTLKALGTFARAASGGSTKHQRLIAPTMERALGCLSRAPETEAIAPDLAARWRR